MKRILSIAAIFFLGWCVGAQTLAPPWQVGVPTAATHTACTVTASTTQMCLASDGLWLSINGAAYVQVQTGAVVAGVTSISINGGTPVSGAVSFTVPSKAVSVTTTTIQ
jgi:hypothetical protein